MPYTPEEERSLTTVKTGTLDKQTVELSIGQLERRLLARFPKSQAESWDNTGLLAGDASQPIRGVVVALDPTLELIDAACGLGANVVLTHHPAFLEAPKAFTNSPECAGVPGAVVYNAIHKGVALMNFHTAFDVSAEAQAVLPGMLGLTLRGVLQPISAGAGLGYGQVCTLGMADAGMDAGHLASRCTAVFGRVPRLWGDASKLLHKVVCANGSASFLVEDCLEADVDCLVAGEIKYHVALDAMQRGLAIIDLGHDVSELPYVGVLAQCAVECGVDPHLVYPIEQSSNWTTPEAIRM